MELFLDPDDRRPRAVQLYEQLRDAINEGRLSAGDRLTPSRTVANELGISRSTVTEVYGRLGAEGYLEGRAGGGSVVSAAQWPARPRLPVAALSPTSRAAATRPYGTNPEATAPFDCRPGHLDPALFPVAAWRRCAIGALDQPVNQYGDPAGTSDLRTALAHWVTRSRGSRRPPPTCLSPPEPGTPST